MSDPSIIPASMRRYLRRYVLRRRLVALLRGLGMAIAFALVWMLAWALVDRLLPLPGFVRTILLFLNVAVVSVMLLRPIRAMVLPRFDWHAAAAQIERRDPRFAGRLETAVSQLLLPRRVQASPQLLDRIVSEADDLATRKAPAPLVSIQPAIRPWGIALLLTILCGFIAPSQWLDLGALVCRQLHPQAPIAAVTTTRISVEPGSGDVAQGGSVTITARASAPLTINLTSDGREFTSQPMTRTGDDGFSFTLNTIDRDWQYDVSGGDARSELYTIRALRRPGIAQFRVRYVYPGYINRSPATVTNSDGALEAPVGTQAIVDFVCTEPVASASVLVNDQRITARATGELNVCQATIPIARSGSYQVQLKSLRGVDGVASSGTVIRAIPDQPPQVEWIDHITDLRLDPFDRTMLRFRLSDDYGVAAAHAEVRVNDSPPRSFPMSAQSGRFEIRLLDWDVAMGDVLRVAIVAGDAAGQASVSEPFYILVAPHSAGIEQFICADELRQAARLSQALADEIPEVLRAERQTRLAQAPGVFGRNTHLSRCADLADQLCAHLLRAMSFNRYSPLSPIVTTLLDQTAIAEANLATAIGSQETSDPDSRSRAIARAEQCIRKLRDQTRDLTAAEQARLIKLDLLNFRTLVDSLPTARNSELLRESLNVAGRTVDARIKALAIDPEDDRLVELLDERIAAGERQFEPLQSDELLWAVEHVSELEMSQRLLTASRAQALRGDADFALARDLNLAATARRTWPDRDIPAFRDALGVLLRQMRVPAESARAVLRRHAQPNAELEAFESAAAVPKKLDITTAAGSVSPVFMRIHRAQQAMRRLPLVSPAEMLGSAEELLVHGEPVEAAHFYADLAAKDHSLQPRAEAAAQLAADRAAHNLAANKIRAVPAIAAMLEDAKPAAIVPAATPAVVQAKPAPTTNTVTVSPGGYDEPLRLYFQMLKGSQ